MHERQHETTEPKPKNILEDIREIATRMQQTAIANPYLSPAEMEKGTRPEEQTIIQFGNRRFYKIILTISPDDHGKTWFWHCSASFTNAEDAPPLKSFLWTKLETKTVKNLISLFLEKVGAEKTEVWQRGKLALHCTKNLTPEESKLAVRFED